mmetsp:Transcript_19785/g.27201  ORF Transcript_19785/g.27201 Transcript_19785/m.27201 type:complete len:258 (+) Transcript_19785:660-1433(+)
MLYSEGNSYNILNHSIYDDQKLKATRTVQDQALNRMKVLQVESRIKDEREMKAEEDDHKKLNKVSYKRWENQIDRGYNMVTNIPDSVSGAYTQPLPTRPTSMWSRLNSTSSDNQVASRQSFGEGFGGLNGSPQASGRGATATSQRVRNLSGYPSQRGDFNNGLTPSLPTTMTTTITILKPHPPTPLLTRQSHFYSLSVVLVLLQLLVAHHSVLFINDLPAILVTTQYPLHCLEVTVQCLRWILAEQNLLSQLLMWSQ